MMRARIWLGDISDIGRTRPSNGCPSRAVSQLGAIKPGSGEAGSDGRTRPSRCRRTARRARKGWSVSVCEMPDAGRCTAIGRRQSELLAGLAVRHCRAKPTLPTDLDPAIQFVQVDVPGKHQQPRRYQFLASPGGAREPPTGNRPGALDADIVASLSHLAKVINQRLQFRPFGGEEGFAVELG